MKRGQIELRMSILEAIEMGYENRLKIELKSNIGGTLFKTHITSILNQGLIIREFCNEDQRTKWVYSLSDSGKKVLRDYRNLCVMLGVKT